MTPLRIDHPSEHPPHYRNFLGLNVAQEHLPRFLRMAGAHSLQCIFTLLCENTKVAAAVTGARFSPYQPSLYHPVHEARNPAAGQDKRLGEFPQPEPVVRRLFEVNQHIELG